VFPEWRKKGGREDEVAEVVQRHHEDAIGSFPLPVSGSHLTLSTADVTTRRASRPEQVVRNLPQQARGDESIGA